MPPVYRRKQYLGVLTVVAIIALLLATVDSKFYYGLMNTWMVYAIVGLGFYVVFGLSGQFAFSQGAFYGLGAYSSAWATREMSFMWGLLAAIVIAGVVALAFALIVFRADQFYFAIATLAFSFIAVVVFREFTAFTADGGEVVGIPEPHIANYTFDTDTKMAILLGAFLILALLLVTLIERSPLRRESLAFHENATVAATLGIPTGQLRLLMFVLGSCIAAAAGSLQAHRTGFISTEQFSVQFSIDIFLILLLGGVGSMWGPLLGAAFVVWAPEQLRFVDKYRGIIYGVLLIVVMVLFPKGLVGIAEEAKKRLKALRRTGSPPTAAPVDAPVGLSDAAG
jgi:branched-chain amino acid transport system permease protein